nr:hypothetical protein [Bacteroidota bacterium]
GQAGAIEPFFSRRIGLSNMGMPIPVDGGARLISRSPKRGYGGLMMRQREHGDSPAAYFGVGRYSKNFGKQNRIGGMITSRFDEGNEVYQSATNMTYSIDGFFRPTQPLSWSFMASASTSSENSDEGFAATSQLIYNSNKLYLFYYQSLISRQYDPKVGFVYSNDIINTNFGGYRIFRPKWKPKALRQLDPGAYINIYHSLSDGSFQQAEIEIFPLYFVFVKGALFYTYIIPTWQRLDQPFNPLGINIPPGNYQYNRFRIYYGNDQSRKLSFRLRYEDGGYYKVRLQAWYSQVRYSPIPQISMSFSFEQNNFYGLENETTTKKTQLITPELRLAVNPRIQLIGFYQKNTAIDRDIWNVRFSWEFAPLSFIYLVYNSNTFDTIDRVQNEQVIGKITFLKQF